MLYIDPCSLIKEMKTEQMLMILLFGLTRVETKE